MLRACPKCGDYYADASLAFCLSDGTPLVSVDPHSESWSEGARVVEAKEQALKRQQRKLKWRRVLMSMMTILMVIMVVCVVVVNSYIYLKPKQEQTALNKPSTLAPVDSIDPNIPDWPVPSPSPRPTATLKPSPTPTPTPSPTPTCSAADKSREKESIIKKFGQGWRQSIAGDSSAIFAGKLPPRAEHSEPKLSALKYEISFSKTCAEGSVTVRYVWEISYQEINPGALPLPPKVITVAQEKNFHCVKKGESWRCG